MAKPPTRSSLVRSRSSLLRAPLARLAAPCLVLLSLGEVARAQLELPRKPAAPAQGASQGRSVEPRRQRGELAPYLECTICFERNYTAPRQVDENGFQQAWCTVCRKSTLHRASSSGGRGKGGALELPEPPPAGPSSTAGGPQTTGAPGGPGALPGSGAAGGSESGPAQADSSAASASGLPTSLPDAVRVAARAFDALDGSSAADSNATAIDRAAQAVLALGEPGRLAARLELAADEPARLLAAAQVLLSAGEPSDGDALVRRLRGRVPNAAAAPLIDLLVRLDPVRASPELLLELVDHPQPAVRAAALRRVRTLPSAALLPHLRGLFASRRADTREKALELAAASEAPEASALLLEALTDGSARVAGKAVAVLGRRKDESLESELVKRASGERWILRSQAYALLAIVEREDSQLRPILDASHVEPLLAGLQTQDPFVSGACASALAGIGFRSAHPAATDWLDRLVPERLVWAVSGREFHNDVSSLLGPALRRLQLISGLRQSGQGQAWIDWWLAAREGFRAQRANLELGPAGADALALAFRSGAADASAFVLLGPAALDALADRGGERIVLSSAEAADVVRVLESEGLLGASRLPGLRGTHSGAERTLELALGSQSKLFQFGAGASEPWFERVLAMASEVRARNRWQRYPPPELAGDLAAFRARELPFWSSEADEQARARHLVELVLAWLPTQPLTQRDGALGELARLYALPQVPSRAHFDALLERLAEERFHAERSRALVALCLRAATAPSAETGEAAARARASARLEATAGALAAERPPWPLALAAAALVPAAPLAGEAPGHLERAPALRLLSLLQERFGSAAADELARVLQAADPALARELAAGESALLRAVAGAVLAHDPSQEDVQVVLGLLSDRDPAVQIALIRALGHERVEEARTELLLRARVGDPLVRQEALRAIGELGGEFVYEALLLGIADSDPGVRGAAAVGLARLGDPRSANYLVRLLDEPKGSEAYGAGLAGLERLGDAARGALGRIVHTRDHPARRDAALILARQAAPEVVPAMIALVEEDPSDAPLVEELCTLTCFDGRGSPEPIEAWWSWWDGVVHDDPSAWYLAALERRGLQPPSAERFRASGSHEIETFLLGVIDAPEAWLVERTRRELERQLGRRVPPVPPSGPEREAWLAVARRWVDAGLER